jgi:hypothetical protein
VSRFRTLVEPDPPPNFLWVYSYGGTQDAALNPASDRVADVFPDETVVAEAGWASQEGSDLLAVLGPRLVGVPANRIPAYLKRLAGRRFSERRNPWSELFPSAVCPARDSNLRTPMFNCRQPLRACPSAPRLPRCSGVCGISVGFADQANVRTESRSTSKAPSTCGFESWAVTGSTGVDHAGRRGRATRGSVAIYFPPVVAIVLGVVFRNESVAAISPRERPWSWREHDSGAARKRTPPFLPRPNLCEAGLGDPGRAPCPPRICLCLLVSRRFYGSVNSCVCGLRWPSRTAPAVVFPLSR